MTCRAAASLFLLVGAAGSQASIITEYTNLGAYNASVGSHTVITFTEVQTGSALSNQYSAQGLLFTDGNDTTTLNNAFVTDGVGAAGHGRLDLSFSTDMTHIGVEFPGALLIELYDGDTLLATSSQFGRGGTEFFGGVVATPFNRAVLIDWIDDSVYIDNLHFGPVPEPASLSLVAVGIAALLRRKQARRSLLHAGA